LFGHNRRLDFPTGSCIMVPVELIRVFQKGVD